MKKRILGAFLATSMLLTSMTCFAKSSDFTTKEVDSNEWTYVTSATKTATTDSASVYVETMYDANKQVASYTKLKVKLGSTGNQSAEQTVTKGKSADFTLSSSYKAKGTSLSMYAKGNDPSLDCYIDGSFNAN